MLLLFTSWVQNQLYLFTEKKKKSALGTKGPQVHVNAGTIFSSIILSERKSVSCVTSQNPASAKVADDIEGVTGDAQGMVGHVQGMVTGVVVMGEGYF